MAKVKAIHEIVRVDGVIKPGKIFTSTGDELKDLKRLGAVEEVSGDDDVTDAEVKPASTKAPGKPTKASGSDLV